MYAKTEALLILISKLFLYRKLNFEKFVYFVQGERKNMPIANF